MYAMIDRLELFNFGPVIHTVLWFSRSLYADNVSRNASPSCIHVSVFSHVRHIRGCGGICYIPAKYVSQGIGGRLMDDF